MLLHLIEENGHHAEHADFLREATTARWATSRQFVIQLTLRCYVSFVFTSIVVDCSQRFVL